LATGRRNALLNIVPNPVRNLVRKAAPANLGARTCLRSSNIGSGTRSFIT